MAHIIQRHTVQEEKVVITRAAVHIQAGEEFISGSHAGKILQGLYNIGAAEEGEAAVKLSAVDVLETSLGPVHLPSVTVRGDP